MTHWDRERSGKPWRLNYADWRIILDSWLSQKCMFPSKTRIHDEQRSTWLRDIFFQRIPTQITNDVFVNFVCSRSFISTTLIFCVFSINKIVIRFLFCLSLIGADFYTVQIFLPSWAMDCGVQQGRFRCKWRHREFESCQMTLQPHVPWHGDQLVSKSSTFHFRKEM